VVDITLVYLKRALGEPGCPICRLIHETEARYLFYLLYENVTDGTTRAHLVRSLGLCPRHAWDMQATEQGRWNDGMGTGIIYEDLIARLLGSLTDHLNRSSPASGSLLARVILRLSSRKRPGRWLKRQGGIRSWLTRRSSGDSPINGLLARLSPFGRCRLCEAVEQTEKTELGGLVGHLVDPEFRKLYEASDGLCLIHLRGALACTEDEETAHYLARVAADQLGRLLSNLSEYGRKHSWSNRDEPKYPWEQASWIRAVAFFAGEPREDGGDWVQRVRRQAMIDHRLRSNEGSCRPQRPDPPKEAAD
jgi:Family of unknown function (DUF6062)